MSYISDLLKNQNICTIPLDSHLISFLYMHREISESEFKETIKRYVPSEISLIRSVIMKVGELHEVGTLEGMSVMEEACGIGLASLMFASLGAEVHAYDVEPKLIAYAKEMVSQLTPPVEGSVEFYEGKWEGKDIVVREFPPPEKFDVWYVYPFANEQKIAAERFMKHSKKGAWLAMNTAGCYTGDLKENRPPYIPNRNHKGIEGLTLQWLQRLNFAIYRNDRM